MTITIERVNAAEALLKAARETRKAIEREIMSKFTVYADDPLRLRLDVARDNEALVRARVYDERNASRDALRGN